MRLSRPRPAAIDAAQPFRIRSRRGTTAGLVGVFALLLLPTPTRAVPPAPPATQPSTAPAALSDPFDPALLAAARFNTDTAFNTLVGALSGAGRDRRGRTALMYAAQLGHLPLIEHLLPLRDGAFGCKYPLSAAAYLDQQDAAGRTALMYASAAGQEHVVLYLLNAGADPSARDRHGYTARQLAMDADQEDCVAAIDERLAELARGQDRTVLWAATAVQIFLWPLMVSAFVALWQRRREQYRETVRLCEDQLQLVLRHRHGLLAPRERELYDRLQRMVIDQLRVTDDPRWLSLVGRARRRERLRTADFEALVDAILAGRGGPDGVERPDPAAAE